MNILGIIPARGGSKEVKRKNLLPVGEHTLIERAINSAKSSKYLSKTIVSTDDIEILETAQRVGGYAPFIRPSELALSASTVAGKAVS